MSASEMSSYFEYTYETLKHHQNSTPQDNNKRKSINIVLGNESCDLDSAVSSIVYAHFLHWLNNNENEVKAENNGDLFIPVLNIANDDFPLKTEVMHFLKQNNVPLKYIICRDTININHLVSTCEVKIYLVDHHILNMNNNFLMPYVVKIFDHRPKDIASWKYKDSVITNITCVGSCATLICHEILDVLQKKEYLCEHKNMANLVYGTIVLDTINFLPEADKARPLDFKMANALEDVLLIKDVNNHRELLFTELYQVRTDHTKLSAEQLLRRDLKIVNNIPIPGLPMLVKNYLIKDNCESALKSFCAKNHFSVIVLMGLECVEHEIYRDLAIYSINKSDIHAQEIIDVLCTSTDPNLELIAGVSTINHCKYFTQNNTKASRKKLIPLLKSLPLVLKTSSLKNSKDNIEEK